MCSIVRILASSVLVLAASALSRAAVDATKADDRPSFKEGRALVILLH